MDDTKGNIRLKGMKLFLFLPRFFWHMFIGELISLGVALSWTATALFAEVGSKRMGSLPFNTIRMTMSLLLLTVISGFQ